MLSNIFAFLFTLQIPLEQPPLLIHKTVYYDYYQLSSNTQISVPFVFLIL